MNVYASGLIHEVTMTDPNGPSTLILTTVCGGKITVPNNFPWRHDDDIVTCFRCIVGESWPIPVITLTCVI